MLVRVKLEEYKRASGRVDKYWRVQWGRQDVRVPVASVSSQTVAVAKDVAMELKAMLEKRGPGRTEKSDVEAYRDELIAEVSSHQHEEAATAAGNEATAGQHLSLGGLNIQWPFSQLILAGAKTVEVRKYALGYIARANEEMWLVETTNAKLEDAVVEGVLLPAKPPCAQIVGTITFARSTPYHDRGTFRADASRHRIAEGSSHDWVEGTPKHAWHISSYRRLVTPIPYPGAKPTVGWTSKSPKSYPGIFVPGDATSRVEQGHSQPERQPQSADKMPSRRMPGKRPLAGTDVSSTAKHAKASSAASSASSAAGHGMSTSAAASGSKISEGPMRHDIPTWQRCIQKFIDDRRAKGGQLRSSSSSSWCIKITADDAERVRSAFDRPAALSKELAKLLRVVLCTQSTAKEFVGRMHAVDSQGSYKLASMPPLDQPRDAPDSMEISLSVPYFERQESGWCGKAALNHYYGARVVEKSDCVAAVREFAKKTGQLEEDHLCQDTGWLSIDIMNILALTRFPQKHIEESAQDWGVLQAEAGVAAMVNWNRTHWTMLKHDMPTQSWMHINSCEGPFLRHGLKTHLNPADVDAILAEIQGSAGGVALHRALVCYAQLFFVLCGFPGFVLMCWALGRSNRLANGRRVRCYVSGSSLQLVVLNSCPGVCPSNQSVGGC